MLNLLALCAMAPSVGAAPTIRNLTPVQFTEVKINDGFWAPRQAENESHGIPHTMRMCETTGRIANFDLAIAGAQTGHKGYIFDDSDVYKCLEAASYALATKHDPALEKAVDAWIAKLAKAQMPDGYLDTAYQIGKIKERFTRLYADHELYCAGHLFEAAVAHYQATGKKTLLNIATKYADLLCNTFGEGRRMGYPGHPEAELALIKLWKATKQQRYFDLAKFFIDHRGEHFFATETRQPEDRYDGTYWLDDVPIREHNEIKGHAVRAAYLFSGAADIASVTGDPKLHSMLDRVWTNTVTKRVFVTGGIGPSGSNEGFTVDYDLPNESAYQETCASVAMVLWNHRMGLMEGDAKYWDWVERALYNGFLAGVSLSGDKFFYVNPLGSGGTHHREEWFGCACCPPNVTRTLASLGQYLYAKSDDSLYVNLYAQSDVKTTIGGKQTQFRVTTKFPWSGTVTLQPLAATSALAVHLRIPSWCRGATLKLNGKAQPLALQGGYAVVRKAWKLTDRLVLELPMPVERIQAHPEVKDDTGLLAVQRGPLVYCFEQLDQKAPLESTYIPVESQFTPTADSKFFGGAVALTGFGQLADNSSWRGTLYRPMTIKKVPLKAIPYYLWDNRAPCAMEMWMPVAPPKVIPVGLEAGATVRLSYTSNICTPNAIKDNREVTASSKHPGSLCHFWPHKGTSEWVEYRWNQAKLINSSQLYWFDDTGVGECRPPKDWHLEYWDGSAWKRIESSTYSVELDRWIKVDFPAIRTVAIRLVMNLQPQWSVGIHEWKVFEPES